MEALSLSILIGSSVDYLIHICEGYIVASGSYSNWSKASIRAFRLRQSIASVGVPVTASAVTTVGASVVLVFTEIQLFAKFGGIVALNTAVSFAYTLTFAAGLLAWFGPTVTGTSLKRRVLAVLVVLATLGAIVTIMVIASKAGSTIRGPGGAPLF